MQLAIKVDVDTERGTRIGVPQLLTLFADLGIPATFLFSLGPDNTGRALKRIFRPGFLRKVRRTKVAAVYGWQTLINGILRPGPHIAKKHAAIMKLTKALGHEVGIHCYDHIRWQDKVQKMSADEVTAEFNKAYQQFYKVFGENAKTAGAAGWQANANSLAAYDAAHLLYGSDTRGEFAFFPAVNGQVFKTLQIPSTLPTLDELLGFPEYPLTKLTDHYLSLLKKNQPNIMTVHAELEGMVYLEWFKEFLKAAIGKGVAFLTVEMVAKEILQSPDKIPVCELIQAEIPGRSGTLAVQKIGS